MAPIKVYGFDLSPPFRTVVATLELLGLEYEIVKTNPINGETQTPEFLKLNPQHNIPIIVDEDLVLNESRPIAAYLVNAYGKDDCKLYPSDPKVRAVVDQRLYFDIGTLFNTVVQIVLPILFGSASEADPAHLKRLHEALGWLRDFIKPTGFVAGTNHLTIADVSIISAYHSLKASNQFDMSPYNPVLDEWFARCKVLIPNYDSACGEGAEGWGQFFQSRIKENSAKN